MKTNIKTQRVKASNGSQQEDKHAHNSTGSFLRESVLKWIMVVRKVVRTSHAYSKHSNINYLT